jgi:hypothetical protein
VADILAGGSSGVKGTRQKGKTELCTSFGWVGFMLDLAWLRADGGLASNEDQRDKAVTGKESFERGCHQECRIEGAVKSRGWRGNERAEGRIKLIKGELTDSDKRSKGTHRSSEGDQKEARKRQVTEDRNSKLKG